VRVRGLDADWNQISEDVVLNGTTPVTTTNEYLRINRMVAILAGTYHGSNAGVITMTRTTGGETMAVIDTGEGDSSLCRFSIPRGFTGVATKFTVALFRSTGTAQFRWQAVFGANQTASNFRPQISLLGQNASASAGSTTLQRDVRQRLPEYTDFWCRCTNVTNNGTTVAAQFDLRLYPNP
jgi:hypothetical protein